MEERVPGIRFKGFEGPWEKCTLGDVGKARSGIGFPDSEQGGKMGMPFYKVSDMNILGNETEMINANNYVTEVQIIRNGWSPIEAVPAIFFAKVGAAVMLNRKRLCRTPFLLDNNTMAYSLDESKWDADFAKALFANVDLTALVQVGALPSYNTSDVEGIEISLTSLLEQKQIGRYFKELDNQIYLSQQKLNQLKTLKKACLEKMFPKEGETVPEIRFKGFEGPWEKTKLKDLMDLGNGRDYKHLQYGNIPVYGTGGYMTNVNAFLSDKDSIGIGRKGTIDKPYILKAPFWTVDTLFYATPKETDLYYLFGLFQIIDWKSKDESTGVPSLSKQNINDIELYSTSDILEQKTIGFFFVGIDSLINLNQQKLDQLKNLKKALLEKMFV